MQLPLKEIAGTEQTLQTSRGRSLDLCVLIFTLLFPTLITWIYFVILHGQSAQIQQIAYGTLKTLQFLLPVLAAWIFARSELRVGHFGRQGVLLGVGFGVFVITAMIALYGLFIRHTPIDSRLQEMIVEKVSSLGMDSRSKFLLLGAFYSIVHSGLEEYYWRWFAFRWAQSIFATWKANALSSIGFMLHHILVLGYFFGFAQWQTWLCSIAIAIGGAYWAWLYDRTNNLVANWLSHALVDAGIFILGFALIGSSLG